MKKQAYITGLLFIFLTLALTSCKKDEPASLGDLLIGKWKMQIVRQVYLLDNVIEFEYIYHYKTNDLAYEFTDGGSIIQYRYGDIFGSTTFTLNNNSIIIENGDVDIEWTNVTTDGNTITWMETGTEVINEVTYDVEYYSTATKSSK